MKYEKGTFVVIPNINALDGKPSEMQSIFTWLCVYANDDGKCFPARRTLANKAGCNLKSVDKYLDQLIQDGFISKETRYKDNSKELLSNMYQILVKQDVPPETVQPSTENGTTPSTENGAVTIPINNYTNLTNITDTSNEVPDQEVIEEVSQLGKLPEKFGKSYIMRLHYIYRYLWKRKYGTRLVSSTIGAFGKAMKTLHENNTEQQIAILLLTYFNWYGGSGDDAKENKYLSDKGFPPYLMINKIDIFVAYLTNNIGLCYTDESKVEEYFTKQFKEIL